MHFQVDIAIFHDLYGFSYMRSLKKSVLVFIDPVEADISKLWEKNNIQVGSLKLGKEEKEKKEENGFQN